MRRSIASRVQCVGDIWSVCRFAGGLTEAFEEPLESMELVSARRLWELSDGNLEAVAAVVAGPELPEGAESQAGKIVVLEGGDPPVFVELQAVF